MRHYIQRTILNNGLNVWRKLVFAATHKAYVASVFKGYAPIMWSQLMKPRSRSSFANSVYLDVYQWTNRSLFNLVWILAKCGFRILIPHNPSRLSQMSMYDKWIFKLPQVELTRHKPQALATSMVLTDCPNIVETVYKPSSIVRISFDYFQKTEVQSDLRLPFGCHPIARIMGFENFSNQFSDKPRERLLFFAGNISSPQYQCSELKTYFGILNRHDFMKIVFNYLRNNQDIDEKIVQLVDQGPRGSGLKMKDYLMEISKSSFILCPPGVAHPQCHNLEEGMMQGAIPVLEYGHLLATPLTDGRNSIAFQGAEGLQFALKKVLSMNEQEISQMRAQVQIYARTYLAPEAAASRLCGAGLRRILLLNEAQSVEFIQARAK